MIDAFAELKDKDATRDEDKEGMCYICSITRSDVIYLSIFRCKKMGKLSTNISKNISYGIIFTIFTVWKPKTKQITQESNI
jgi:hypothetical protein